MIPPASSTSRRLIERAFLRAGLRLEIAMEAGGWEIVKRLVRAGVGVAMGLSLWRFRRGISSLRMSMGW